MLVKLLGLLVHYRVKVVVGVELQLFEARTLNSVCITRTTPPDRVLPLYLVREISNTCRRQCHSVPWSHN